MLKVKRTGLAEYARRHIVSPSSGRYRFTVGTGVGDEGTKVCRYNWHSVGSLGWPFPVLKYKFLSEIKYTEAIVSNSTRKLLWFEITKMLIVDFKMFLLCHLA